MNKYNAKRTEVDGIKFDSKAEAGRYVELKMLQKAGEISGLTLQPAFILQEPFKHPQHGSQRGIFYRADFKYVNKEGLEVVEDVKGVLTDVYKIKKKLFLMQYPHYLFYEVK
jgi:hypothetical protein